MKFIVTGGAGFIGGNFMHYMVNKYPEDEFTLEGLALGGTGCLGIRETNDTGTKTVGSGLETELGTSRWLEEKGRYDLSLQQLPVRVLFELLRHFQEVHDFLLGKVCNGHKIMFFHLKYD